MNQNTLIDICTLWNPIVGKNAVDCWLSGLIRRKVKPDKKKKNEKTVYQKFTYSHKEFHSASQDKLFSLFGQLSTDQYSINFYYECLENVIQKDK